MPQVQKFEGEDRRSFLRRAALAGAGAFGLTQTRRLAAAAAAVDMAEAKTHLPGQALRVLIWCEGTAPPSVYPHDIDGALASHLSKQPAMEVRRTRLTEPQAGLSDALLDASDVLIWWGHLRHDDVPGDRAEAVVRRVRRGELGLIALHSSCGSKPFKGLMGRACEPGLCRDDGRPEHVHIKAPDHPIARGVAPFTIPRSDTFAEPFHVPEPETVVLVSNWDRGETVRSGMTWTIDRGRVVYLRTSLDAFPALFHPVVRQIVANATRWAGKALAV